MEIPALSVPIVHIAITITVTCEDTQFRVVETGFLPWTLTTGGRVPDIESDPYSNSGAASQEEVLGDSPLGREEAEASSGSMAADLTLARHEAVTHLTGVDDELGSLTPYSTFSAGMLGGRIGLPSFTGYGTLGECND